MGQALYATNSYDRQCSHFPGAGEPHYPGFCSSSSLLPMECTFTSLLIIIFLKDGEEKIKVARQN